MGLTGLTAVISIDYSVHSSSVTLPSNVLPAYFPLQCWAQSGVLMLLYHPEGSGRGAGLGLPGPQAERKKPEAEAQHPQLHPRILLIQLGTCHAGPVDFSASPSSEWLCIHLHRCACVTGVSGCASHAELLFCITCISPRRCSVND